MHTRFILDSLRPGPQEVEYGQLYSYLNTILEGNKGIVLLIYPASSEVVLPLAEPRKFKHLKSHQFFLTLEQIRGLLCFYIK